MANDVCGIEFQPSLRNSFAGRAQPRVETPGYCRVVPAGTKAGDLRARDELARFDHRIEGDEGYLP